MIKRNRKEVIEEKGKYEVFLGIMLKLFTKFDFDFEKKGHLCSFATKNPPNVRHVLFRVLPLKILRNYASA